jgi:hypothetical protein
VDELASISDDGLDDLESFSPFRFECAVRPKVPKGHPWWAPSETYVLTGGLLRWPRSAFRLYRPAVQARGVLRQPHPATGIPDR